MTRKYRVMAKVTVQRSGGQITLNKYIRRNSIQATHNALTKWLESFERDGYKIIKQETTANWLD